ncbi:uncharacterized protein PGTG_05661 [Puccinia graminis f. sp. tritici CRL 75-36-700-3]|uniref:Uncharacterized protein n=1 Tax=Puccinia graminis f. sp. tritici (strain CRL 75-36-700-3 / race SCCL) TaxID=418459 RepID=E3K525_PUCGT|nr:uncharacterized protein PGTG_05661 [Puccinia graminis f. sp. tritici CRL 75-36-700-3]EFP79340.2 hypothetical protein PGTG_05661 [Puccinia graminis f. sp. tritici CRL 75-36-700-3]
MNEHEFDPSKSLSLSEISSELLAVGKWSNKKYAKYRHLVGPDPNLKVMTGPHELKKLPGSSLKDNKNVFLDGRNHNQKVSNHKEYKDAIYHDQEISDFERNKVHKEKDEVYQNPEISDFEMNNLPKQEMVRDASKKAECSLDGVNLGREVNAIKNDKLVPGFLQNFLDWLYVKTDYYSPWNVAAVFMLMAAVEIALSLGIFYLKPVK